MDRHSIYRDEDHLDCPAQFGRACKELAVELILAHSPQVKGRAERRNALVRDRLVKDLNRCYAVKARKERDLHRPAAAGLVLEEILCVQEMRVV